MKKVALLAIPIFLLLLQGCNKDEKEAEIEDKIKGEVIKVREELKEELKGEIKEELKEKLKQEIKTEAKEELKEEMTTEIKGEIKEALIEKSKTEIKAESKKVIKSSVTKNIEKSLTVDEFNKKFDQDPEEEQFPNGKYQLKDGSIVKADSYSYRESTIFDYATVTFFKGKIAHLQMDTKSSIESIEKGLGISLKDARIEKYKYGNGYEVIFDETFSDENIARFPNEWD